MKNNIKKHHRFIRAALLASATLLTSTQLFAGENSLTSGEEPQLTKSNIVYQYDEVFGFDIENYLAEKAPHLVPYAESIAHFSGESTISPKVFLALMEHQTNLISSKDVDESALAMPFGVMSQKYGFNEQLKDIADRISQAYYQGHSFEETGKNQKFTSDSDARRAIQMIFSYGIETTELQPGSDEQIQSFSDVFFKMFPEAANAPKQLKASSTTMMVPSTRLLQLPFPRGQRWRNGGSHTTNGSGSYPQSSLDFNNGGRWGDNLTNRWVSASASGRVRVYSSCSMEVFHSGGWSTKYYHLSGIRVRNGSYVSKNTRLANYASRKSQALCNGGHSTGPHVHWSLKLNGQYYHLNNVTISGYKVRTGRQSYDTNCNYFWLQKNGRKYCARSRIYNSGSTSSYLSAPQEATNAIIEE